MAAKQHGVVCRADLLAAGLSIAAVRHRLANERLHPLHRGVYLVGHPVPPPLAREMAAVLACGDGAVASHHTSASMQGLIAPHDGPIHITLTSRSKRLRPGIRVHRSATLAPQDIRHHHGIPITSPARTIIDLAETLSPRALHRAYEEARI
jgi:hypothetical protein